MALKPKLIERNRALVPLHAPDPQNRLNLNPILTRPTSRLLPLIRVQLFSRSLIPEISLCRHFLTGFVCYIRARGAVDYTAYVCYISPGLQSIRMLFTPEIK